MYFDVLNRKELVKAIDYFSTEVENSKLTERQLELSLEYMSNLRYLYELLSMFPSSNLSKDERDKIMAIMGEHGLTVEELCTIPHPKDLS